MKTVSASTLKGMIDRNKDLQLLNVLPAGSHREKHIPGSSNVPYDDEHGESFARRVRDVVGDTGKKVVVYCASGTCDLSPRAAKSLEDAGFAEVVDFEGGVAAWERAGYPLATASK